MKPNQKKIKLTVRVRRGLSRAHMVAFADYMEVCSDGAKAFGMTAAELRDYGHAIEWLQQKSLPSGTCSVENSVA